MELGTKFFVPDNSDLQRKNHELKTKQGFHLKIYIHGKINTWKEINLKNLAIKLQKVNEKKKKKLSA